MGDPTAESLSIYKSAYSDVYGCRVEIVKIRTDDSGRPILDCKVPDCENLVLFRVDELTLYSRIIR